jgi:cephalosporin hydroxylase
VNYRIDTEAGTVTVADAGGEERVHPVYSTEGFEALSDLWLKVGWNQKHTYTFSWMGRPIVQLPEDLIRLQEVVHRIQPDVILETGIAHGGSLVYSASLLEVLGKGRVIGVDIEIRPHNREAIEAHPLFARIELIEGSSIAPEVVDDVRSRIQPGETVMVLLDSAHDRAHVLAELEAYSPLVSPGSYIVAMDGIMRLVHDVPRGDPTWDEDNPITAAEQFVAGHPEFVIEQPAWPFNESDLVASITHSPSGYIRRRGPDEATG